ncbi:MULTISPECIES: hypothetical protein [unclassified Arsenophonus]|uniref:hypothetical protein n=1 Tax=unclassified Arsenophonus TaxID=2627083 RepID=UPI00285CB800|nr:hypothetical protein [Arsenophonus sp.]MDR5611084.1 hypothetical protein [Arsenophonus sp.]MDR5615036.1 hypothetical protein [Arsenophonus sp.]
MKILNDFIAGVNQALFPNQATPQQLNQTRQLLSEQTQNCHQPFGRAVYNINGSMGTHGADIPSWKARQYAQDSTDVENGLRSNTSAFARSSVGWAQIGDPAGTIMNFGGALLAGAIDGTNYTTGNILRMEKLV